ncbi:hypothetical protein QBC38DRAFT_440372 [Podospora fimiseda]|uniref:Uncharacterized protein n=1 Tax=Podospora fimiseda TaxID=252190 RepID=A0AAN7BWN8_9PEZI|nr:hypothetical protein QBC38DRAFT_440372 [Podospora fimiseda]
MFSSRVFVYQNGIIISPPHPIARMCFGSKPKPNESKGKANAPMTGPYEYQRPLNTQPKVPQRWPGNPQPKPVSQRPLNTQPKVSQRSLKAPPRLSERPPIPPTLPGRSNHFNPNTRPSRPAQDKVPARPADPRPLALNAPHYNPSIRPSLPEGAPRPQANAARPPASNPRPPASNPRPPAGMPRRQATYQVPPTPYPALNINKIKQPSPVPALPSTFTTFNPARKGVTVINPATRPVSQVASVSGISLRSKPKPPPLMMNKAGIRYQSPYTLTQNETRAGLSPQSVASTSWSSWTSHVSSIPSPA